ncbi:methionine-R-sulfoxide reductase [Methanocorpusculum labreanum Z]|uniref:Peptide methionine sulfoxide reductase MsrA n=1 Tax=Methanocorpusculum labreanum (strain ATCC 43576 / DSM 4855 / Z) TaxID=410358 RepID=A2SR10_METLZ|nr:peptide-methionine (R)-S-oxide reductase MsrB [Methanocorpusculum labreanum]ABN06766.1 methionine-R-sulfoxide reductase [Methanocorpusculum labreanum Z]
MTMEHNRESAQNDETSVIYFAGGCFWGMEKLMQSIPGVIQTTVGYANGNSSVIPDYKTVSSGKTGYRETVRVEYDSRKVSLDALLFSYFRVIDPTLENRQGNDRGTQYQTGIYYVDDSSKETVMRIAEIERERNPVFNVEIGPLTSFYDAEEYHQKYLDKNPGGYCHIGAAEFKEATEMIIDPGKYPRPKKETLAEMLDETAFRVTQHADTEPAFQNAFWDRHEKGVYVDVVTGEPLFTSSDKYQSSCGWPAFSKSIDDNTIVSREDTSFGMRRTEVKSRSGNSHLGHVFSGDPESPSGMRYCINSASLRFIPYADMEKEGYGYLKSRV